MKKRIVFEVPMNLDMDGIISKNYTAFVSKKLHKEKLLYIIDTLLKSRMGHRKQMEEDATLFAPLSTKMLQDVIRHYKEHLEFLMDAGIVECDNHFIVGVKCRGYRLSAEYLGKKLKQIDVSTYSLKKSIRLAYEKWEAKNAKELWGYGFLTKWWDSKKIEIDVAGARAWIAGNLKRKILFINSDKSIKDKKEAINNAKDTAMDFRRMVDAIHFHKNKYRFSGDGHRFYNPITHLKRELRQFLTYDGQPLVEIDIKNSQPFFVIALLDESFWQNFSAKFGKKLKCNKNTGSYINKCICKGIITLVVSSKTQVPIASELKNYIDLVSNGKFYEYVLPYFEMYNPKKQFDRKTVKTEVLTVMYSENWRAKHIPTTKLYLEKFPTIFKIFEAIKKDQHSTLPILLQRIESHLVIDVICKRISHLQPHIPLFTIHDNIITTQGNEGFVRQIMEHEIQSWIGHKPTLSCKELAQQRMAA